MKQWGGKLDWIAFKREWEVRNWRQEETALSKFCCKEKQKNGAVAGHCVNHHFVYLFLSWEKQVHVCMLTETLQRGGNDAGERGQT